MCSNPISVQPDALIIGMVSTATVDLRDRVHVTGKINSVSITPGNNVTVDGKQTTTKIPVVGDSIAWTASVAAGNVPGWDLQPGQAQSLAPGRYGALAVKNGATLTLNAAGRYFFESLDLETGAKLVVASADKPTEIYVHGSQLILRGALSGATGLEERLAIIYDGTNEVFVEAPLRGAIVATKAQVTLRKTSAPHRGAVFANTVLVDAGATVQPVAQPFFLKLSTLSLPKCSWAIPPHSTGNKRQDEFQYQYEILKYCAMPDSPEYELRLRGQFNYEATESAAAMSKCIIQPAQYIAFLRRRAAQIKAAVANPALASRIVKGPDTDGDWVPDSVDNCVGTPLWTPVDDNGCPTSYPPGPACADVQAIMEKMTFAVNPACNEAAANMPNIDFAVAVYLPAQVTEGIYLYVQDLPTYPKGCEPWYEFEVRTLRSGTVVDHFSAAFPYASVSHQGRVVPAIPQPYVELHAAPDAAGAIGHLGQAAKGLTNGTIDKMAFRVRAVSGIGTGSAWGRWRIPEPINCQSVGFTCAY